MQIRKSGTPAHNTARGRCGRPTRLLRLPTPSTPTRCCTGPLWPRRCSAVRCAQTMLLARRSPRRCCGGRPSPTRCCCDRGGPTMLRRTFQGPQDVYRPTAQCPTLRHWPPTPQCVTVVARAVVTPDDVSPRGGSPRTMLLRSCRGPRRMCGGSPVAQTMLFAVAGRPDDVVAVAVPRRCCDVAGRPDDVAAVAGAPDDVATVAGRPTMLRCGRRGPDDVAPIGGASTSARRRAPVRRSRRQPYVHPQATPAGCLRSCMDPPGQSVRPGLRIRKRNSAADLVVAPDIRVTCDRFVFGDVNTFRA
jgi:hypothetical protein